MRRAKLIVVAVSGGVAIAMIPIIWETLQLPGLGQTPITAFVIMTAMRHEPGWKAATRAFGCLLGGLYGLVAMSWIGGATAKLCILAIGAPPRFSAIERHAAFRNAPSRPPTRGQQPVTDRQNVESDRSRT